MSDKDFGQQCRHSDQKNGEMIEIVRLGALESHMCKLGEIHDRRKNKPVEPLTSPAPATTRTESLCDREESRVRRSIVSINDTR
jgi:hypothetical protein